MLKANKVQAADRAVEASWPDMPAEPPPEMPVPVKALAAAIWAVPE